MFKYFIKALGDMGKYWGWREPKYLPVRGLFILYGNRRCWVFLDDDIYLYRCLHVGDVCAVSGEKSVFESLMCSIFGEKKVFEGSIPNPCQLVLLGDEIMGDNWPIMLFWVKEIFPDFFWKSVFSFYTENTQ